MIIVIQDDYEWSETIGVFETLEKVLDHMRKNNMKPQHYRFEEIINETEFKTVGRIPQWCEENGCNLDRGLQKFNRWNRMYCPPHYDKAVIKGNEQDRLYKLRQAEADRLEIERRIKREKFEKKWDINGCWYSDFIYEEGTEEETKEKVDYWKDGNWMSGSSYATIKPNELGADIIGEGEVPVNMDTTIIRRMVEPRKKDDEVDV